MRIGENIIIVRVRKIFIRRNDFSDLFYNNKNM